MADLIGAATVHVVHALYLSDFSAVFRAEDLTASVFTGVGSAVPKLRPGEAPAGIGAADLDDRARPVTLPSLFNVAVPVAGVFRDAIAVDAARPRGAGCTAFSVLPTSGIVEATEALQPISAATAAAALAVAATGAVGSAARTSGAGVVGAAALLQIGTDGPPTGRGREGKDHEPHENGFS